MLEQTKRSISEQSEVTIHAQAQMRKDPIMGFRASTGAESAVKKLFPWPRLGK
jgi:hypothetical protein